jgi:hypothetical protein
LIFGKSGGFFWFRRRIISQSMSEESYRDVTLAAGYGGDRGCETSEGAFYENCITIRRRNRSSIDVRT